MGKINRKEMLTVRVPKSIISDLNSVSKFNNSTRSNEIIRYLKEGIEESKKHLKIKYVAFSIMILAIASAGLYIWLAFSA